MAKASLSAPAGAINPAHTPNAIFLFTRFLQSLPALIAAERDMIGMSGHDPAFDHWFTAAEETRKATLACLADLRQAAAGTPLGGVGELFHHLMVSDDPEKCAAMRRIAAYDRGYFLRAATQPASRAVNLMIHLALDRFEDYAAIEEDITNCGADIPEGRICAHGMEHAVLSAA